MALTRTPPTVPHILDSTTSLTGVGTDFPELATKPTIITTTPPPPQKNPRPPPSLPSQPPPPRQLQVVRPPTIRIPIPPKHKVKPAVAPEDEHVTIWNRRERRKIAGNAAPLRKNVARYLSEHPHCEEYTGQDAKGGKPKKSIKRKRPSAAANAAAAAAAAAAVANANGGGCLGSTNVRTFTSSHGRCYDARKCRLMRCGIHADLHPSLLGSASCPDEDALADPETFDSDFAAMLRAQAAELAEPPALSSPAKGFATPLPAELVLDELPMLCSDFSDEESLSAMLC